MYPTGEGRLSPQQNETIVWQSEFKDATGNSYAYVVVEPGDGWYPAMVRLTDFDLHSPMLGPDAFRLGLTLQEAANRAFVWNQKHKPKDDDA